MNSENYIQFKNITKAFPGVRALDDVSFSIKKGETHAILGENGAGKSTLLNILHGIYQPSSGDICIDGEKVVFSSANDAIRYGIAKVHQEINLIPEMTVAQNIMLGNEPRKGGLIDYRKMNREAGEILKRLRSNINPSDKTGNLSNGEMQILQIAKALYLDTKVISLDEPTASLSSKESDALFEIIDDLKKRGITILYISHRLDEIFKLADRATVMRDGRCITTFDMSEVSKEELTYNMVGRDVSMFATRCRPCCVDPNIDVMKVSGLNVEGTVKNVNFSLKKGEILGFFGLVGAGRTDVMRAVFGADRKSSAEICIHGKAVNINSPCDAVKCGIALIPEDRKRQGFNYNFTNRQNASLASLKKFTKFGVVNHKEEARHAAELASSVNLRPNDPEFITSNLSGGNQQKVVLSKWLSASGEIFIFDEPTKGIDVGAKAEIYGIMEDLIEGGKSIIMVSSELPEIMGLCDRLFIMKDGEIVAEMNRAQFNEQQILTYALEGDKE